MGNSSALLTIKDRVQNVLSIPWIRAACEYLNLVLLAVLSKSGILSGFYCSFFPGSFCREQHAVLSGRLRFYRRAASGGVNLVALRRNIHRLEKGLTMRPRRPVFATAYIGETVEQFAKLLDTPELADSPDARWALDVLRSYFETVESHPKINEARTRFASLKTDAVGLADAAEPFVPYRRAACGACPISYDDFYRLTRVRRSVRWFLDQPVDRALIDQAILAAAQSPSACNRQPFEFYVFDDPEAVRTVAGVPFGTLGYADNIPMIVVVVGKLDCFPSARDRHVIYVDASLAAMSFLFALETLGLSSCVINWPDFGLLEAKMTKLLGLGRHERPVMLIAVGHADPDGMVPFSAKKAIAEIRRYNHPVRDVRMTPAAGQQGTTCAP